ncbi:hypothetical protein NIES4071_86030 [Calothrix sp. NIES-4071]|nr:hypothetical protein NIES4071_86030 [Calothrix sp. NIES-4071]BAZ62870.1 hypothetical protein NIES4105_85960 [Calothrix sp. NIES-4105]
MKNHRPARTKVKLLLFLLVSNLTILFAGSASSQITPDNTLGAERSIVTPNGNNIQGLPATLIQGGATRGVNLFQSFSQFNVGDGQRVYFANPQGIQNILSRITGSDPSKIFGTLGVDGKANLFFLNPNGIIFGPNARLDIAGSFFASTANSFVFDNGLQFSATNPEAPPLITVSIRPGLQFGANSPTISNTGNLQTGQDLTLAGVKLDLQGKLEAGKDLTLSATDTVKVRDTATNPFIASASGKLLLQGNQNVDIFALNHPNSGFFSGSDMVLRSANTVGGDAHYWANGNFRIEKLDGNVGNLFSPYDPVIRASGDVNVGDYEGASLHILAGGSVTLGTVNITGADSQYGLPQEDITLSDGTLLRIDGINKATLDVRAGTTNFGSPGVTPEFLGGGDIYTPVPSPLDGGTPVPNPLNNSISSVISNQTQTQGAKITIQGINIAAFNGQVFLTNQYQPNTKLPAGSIEVTGASPNSEAGNFSITAFSNPVAIDARGDVQVARGIITGTEGFTGGNINILSSKDINIGGNEARSGFPRDWSGSLLSLVNDSDGGNISLKANGNINVNNNIASRIISGTGTAGNVALEANGDIRVGNIEASSNNSDQGNFNKVTIQSNQGSVFLNNSRISTSNSGSNFAGDIVINAGNEVSILNSSSPSGTLDNEKKGIFSQGNRGQIFIGTPNVLVPKVVTISNSELNTNNRGVTDNSNVASGNISIHSTGKVTLDNSTVVTDTFGSGKGGNIDVNAQSLFLENGAQLASQSQASGDAGKVTISLQDTLSLITLISSGAKPSSIFTLAQDQSTGNGGDIDITTGSLVMKNGSEILANNFGSGENTKAGNITVRANNGNISLDGFRVDENNSFFPTTIATNVSFRGQNKQGGTIDIGAASLNLTNGGQITSNVEPGATGQAGNIKLNISGDVIFEGVGGVGKTFANNDRSRASGILSSVQEATSNGKAGNIEVTGGNIFLKEGATLRTDNIGSGFAGDISITARNQVLIGGDNGKAEISSRGNFGRIFIGKSNEYASFSPQTVEIKNSTLSTTSSALSEEATNNTGNANSGPISIDTGSLLLNGADINTNTVTRGNAGDITINATNGGVDLNNSTISSQVLSRANLLPQDIANPKPEEFRNGGNINITAGSFKLSNNSQINAFVNTSNSDLNAKDRPFANAGNININVGNGNFEINAASNGQGITGIFSTLGNGAAQGFTNATGRGGDITIISGSMLINGNSPTNTIATPNAGIAAKTFGIGDAGKIDINTGSLTIQNGGFIDNGTTRNGNAGSINITAQSVNLANDSPNRRAIQSAVQAGTEKGNGGDIFINTGSLSLNNASIDASVIGTQGNAGTINITANSFDAREGGQVRSVTNTTNSDQTAGGIILKVKDNITLSGSRLSANPNSDQNSYYIDANNRIPSGIFATTGANSAGKGGSISIDPEQVTITDGARIAVDSRGSGDAGQIQLEASRLNLDQGNITANTNNGNGGNIALNVRDLLSMRRNSLISTTAGQTNGNGGNININGVGGSVPLLLTVPGENNDIIANARTGTDGRVTINALGGFGFNPLTRQDLQRLDPQNQNPRDLSTNDITAISSQVSPINNQEVQPNSPESEISEVLINLPQTTVDTSRLVPQRCENFAGRGSEFVNTGNGGLPPRPDEPLNSDAVWKDTRLTAILTPQKVPTATNTTSKTAVAPPKPATTWVFNGKGEVTLVSAAPGTNSSFNNTSICPVR